VNDVEARVFVASCVAEGFRRGNPDVESDRITEMSREMVNVIVDNYLKLRYLTDEQPISGKERAS
jgi:hypothetical protein